MNGRSQAVRLPKEFRFAGSEVNVERRGNEVVLTPVEGKWVRVVRELPRISDAEAELFRRLAAENRLRREPPVDLDD